MLKYPRLLLECGPKLLGSYLFHINCYAAHPERYPLEERYAVVRSLVIYILDRYRLDWKVRGLENLRTLEKGDKRFLLVSNHQSDLDPLALIYWCEKPMSFVAKKETLKMPFIGKAVKALDGVFLDRKDLRQSFEVMKTVESRLASGYCNYAIYPEGTRNKAPETTPVAPFHPGSFKPAFAAGVSVLPLAIYGTFRPFHASPDPKRNPLEFTFLNPLLAADMASSSTNDVAASIYAAIGNEVESFRKEDAAFYASHNEKVPLKKGPLR